MERGKKSPLPGAGEGKGLIFSGAPEPGEAARRDSSPSTHSPIYWRRLPILCHPGQEHRGCGLCAAGPGLELTLGVKWVWVLLGDCSHPEPHSCLYEIELSEPTPGVLETREVPVSSPTSLLNPDSFPRSSTHGSWP